VSVSKNTALSDDFALNIHSCLAAVTTKLSTVTFVVSALFCSHFVGRLKVLFILIG